ncbi:hypothetical protein SAMN05216378_4539 [Paenibacillus catalpae]|uniref:Uncharacterized protein n=1 Tax=Paenibacillus catalpae TaxID=1045775 RepID=A0A1I2EWF7_9BACL|nr:hypothetical protein [Paenibacillus catalpae]SFE96947.1 hypothetical protein SAMN05216378_4539 [Paenibacillus catalpae]
MAIRYADLQVRESESPAYLTDEDTALVQRYILLGIVMLILDHDIRVMGTGSMKLPRLYESLLRGIQDRVLLEQASLRMQFRKTGIKLVEERRQKDGLETFYICRGSRHRCFLLWSYLKAESEQVIKQFYKG